LVVTVAVVVVVEGIAVAADDVEAVCGAVTVTVRVSLLQPALPSASSAATVMMMPTAGSGFRSRSPITS
jgi:hypothetical protein